MQVYTKTREQVSQNGFRGEGRRRTMRPDRGEVEAVDTEVQEFDRDGIPIGCMQGMHRLVWLMAGGLLGFAVIVVVCWPLALLIVARIAWALWRNAE